MGTKSLLPLVIGFSSLVVSACSQTSIHQASAKLPKNYTTFFVTAPATAEQANLMRKTLANAQADGINGATQIIQPGNRHVLVEICQHDTPDFITPQSTIGNLADGGRVTQATLKSLKLVVENKKQCVAKPISLIEITKNFNKAALSGEKLIIILQAPWARNEISNSNITDLAKSINRLAATKKVARLVLIGIHPDGADRLTGAFESLNKNGGKTVAVASSISDVVEQLKSIRTDLLTP